MNTLEDENKLAKELFRTKELADKLDRQMRTMSYIKFLTVYIGVVASTLLILIIFYWR